MTSSGSEESSEPDPAKVDSTEPEQSGKQQRSAARERLLRAYDAARLAVRKQPWGFAAALGCAAIYALLWASYFQVQPGGSDSFYTFLIARSLAFDFDLHFANDYRICGDPQHHNYDLGTGRPANFFYSGPAFVLTPLLWLARLVVPLPSDASAAEAAGCTGAYVTFALAFVPLIGGFVVYLSYRAARRLVDDVDAGTAAAIFGLTTPLIAYASTLPAFSHVYSALFTSSLVVAAFRAFERPESMLRWSVASALLVPAVLSRPPNLLYAAVPLVLAVVSHRRLSRAQSVPPEFTGRKVYYRLIVVLGTILAGGAAGTGLQLLINDHLLGGYFVSLTGRHYAHFAHAHPFLLLFGIKGGFFYHTPTAYLAVVGFFLLLRRHRGEWPLYLPLSVVAVLQVYVYSANIGWHAFGTFGARKLTELICLLTICAAPAVASFRGWLRRKEERWTIALATAILVPLAFMYTGAVYGMKRRTISITEGESQERFFGEGVKQAFHFVDEFIGPVAVWPAAALFSLRYDLPITAYRAATEPQNWYSRLVREAKMNFRKDTLSLNSKILDETTSGGTRVGGGRELGPDDRLRIVFTAEWPFLTHVIVHGQPEGDCRVRVVRGRLFGDQDYGEAPLVDGAGAVLKVPAGAFSSGINELKIEIRGATCRSALIEKIRLEDRNTYDPPFDDQKRSGRKTPRTR